MAEGRDPETTNPFNPHRDDDDDDDDKTPLLPHEEGEEMGMKHRPVVRHPPGYPKTSTSTSSDHEISFIDDSSSAKTHTSNVELQKEEIESKIKRIFYKPTASKFFSRIDKYEQVVIKLRRINAKDYVLINSSGELALDPKKLPKELRLALGSTNEEINQENYEKQKKEEEKLEKAREEKEEASRRKAENDEKLRDAEEREENLNKVVREQEDAKKYALTSEDKETYTRSIETSRNAMREVSIEVDGFRRERDRLEQAERNADAQVDEREGEVETARERVNERLLSLKDRVKEILKKHGFTIVAVAAAIGTVIGVIVSSLKAGLAKVAKGVGNGLKDLGKLLGKILPGMIGAIANFIFSTAGEVIGFLAKHAWLLVVGLVVLVVEQFKKKSR